MGANEDRIREEDEHLIYVKIMDVFSSTLNLIVVVINIMQLQSFYNTFFFRFYLISLKSTMNGQSKAVREVTETINQG